MFRVIFVSLFVLIFGYSPAVAEEQAPGPSAPSNPGLSALTGPVGSAPGGMAPGSAAPLQLVRVSDLANSPAVTATYRVTAYVSWRSDCPPCPANAVCGPCMPPSIVISDSPSGASVPGNDITLGVADAEQFKVGSKYNITFSRTVDYVVGGVSVRNQLVEASEGGA